MGLPGIARGVGYAFIGDDDARLTCGLRQIPIANKGVQSGLIQSKNL
jgi:hypothetical protein